MNVPKGKKTFCKKCKKHAAHKVTQYKTGKASLYAQGERLPAGIAYLVARWFARGGRTGSAADGTRLRCDIPGEPAATAEP